MADVNQHHCGRAWRSRDGAGGGHKESGRSRGGDGGGGRGKQTAAVGEGTRRGGAGGQEHRRCGPGVGPAAGQAGKRGGARAIVKNRTGTVGLGLAPAAEVFIDMVAAINQRAALAASVSGWLRWRCNDKPNMN